MKQEYFLVALEYDGMEKAGISPGKRYPIEQKFCIDSYYAIINDRGNLMQVPIDHVGIGGDLQSIGKKYYLEVETSNEYKVLIGINVDPSKVFVGEPLIKSGFLSGGYVKSVIHSDKIATEHKSATEILDKYLPGYRRSDKGFNLPDSVEWIAKLNESHRNDCMRYEKIIENIMEAFDIPNHDELAKFAENMKKSANIIDAVRKK